jgi:hypothetical protein
MKYLLTVFISLLLLSSPGLSKVWEVPGDCPTIQAGLDSCQTGDTVLVAPGIYYESLDWPATQSICLMSESGVTVTIIDGGQIEITSGVDTTTVIKGFTIQNGASHSAGGGILCGNGSSPLIIGNVIKNNTVTGPGSLGGGIFCDSNASPIITDNVIAYNVASCSHWFTAGGGIACFSNSNPIITNNLIIGNGANMCGGGIYIYEAHATIIGNIIDSNGATEGGGIYCHSDSLSYIGNNIIKGNSVNLGPFGNIGLGGGIYCKNASPQIINNHILENESTFLLGGGIYLVNSSPLINGNTISMSIGDGIHCKSNSQPIINFNDICENTTLGVNNVDLEVTIDALHNWWGDPSGPFHPILNPGGLGDTISDYIEFDPWLTQPIPVELISFTATTQARMVILNWTTATEINNLGFEIERKIILNEGNEEWTTIGFREGYGTTTESKEYSYVDDISTLNATSLAYRLKQIDYDGSFEYSDEVLVANPAPIDFALEQNYPNPFNPSTRLKYSIPQTSDVVIKIFDILGNEIETLVNEEKQIGTYEITWIAEELPSGVYFYRLHAGDFIQTKKMILMK